MSIAATRNEALINSFNSAAQTAKPGGVQEIQDRFLKLLVAQLQNQDPMNPMENAELTSQLAQMSTVEGVNNLNKAMGELVQSYRASQGLMATTFLDRAVLAEGDRLRLSEGRGGGGVALDAPADRVTVEIIDDVGQVVRNFELGRQDAGVATFAWDGRNNAGQPVAEGVYMLRARAELGGKAVAAKPLSLRQVMSVSFAGDGVSLETDLGTLTTQQVRRVY